MNEHSTPRSHACKLLRALSHLSFLLSSPFYSSLLIWSDLICFWYTFPSDLLLAKTDSVASQLCALPDSQSFNAMCPSYQCVYVLVYDIFLHSVVCSSSHLPSWPAFKPPTSEPFKTLSSPFPEASPSTPSTRVSTHSSLSSAELQPSFSKSCLTHAFQEPTV